MGRIESIYIASAKRQPMQRIDSAELEKGKGIVGDRYHALADRILSKGMRVPLIHLSLVAQEQLEAFIQYHGLKLDFSDFRRSIITSGIDLNTLEGKKFRLGTALCFGVELCEPCSFLARITHTAVLPDLEHKAGLRATVIESGCIKSGDLLSVIS
ncbi:MAG: hypothetical protein OXE78_09810 [Gammaproteobacteria bacterium]|nr:hypothetical protein [Gammaproteobacteria bacterium]MCY4357920.1 hypothetical protein [Gammaproteobacteria bacterium]